MDVSSAKDKLMVWTQVKSFQVCLVLFAATYAVQITMISNVSKRVVLFVEEVNFLKHMFGLLVFYGLTKLGGWEHRELNFMESLPHLLCVAGLSLSQSFIWIGSFIRSLYADHVADWFSIVLGLLLCQFAYFKSDPALLNSSRTTSKLIVIISAAGLLLIWLDPVMLPKIYTSPKMLLLGYGSELFLVAYTLLIRKYHSSHTHQDGQPQTTVVSHAIAISRFVAAVLAVRLFYKWIPYRNNRFSFVNRILRLDASALFQLAVGNISAAFNSLIILWLLLNTQYETYLILYSVQQSIIWILFAMGNRWITWTFTNTVGIVVVASCTLFYMREQLQSRKYEHRARFLPL